MTTTSYFISFHSKAHRHFLSSSPLLFILPSIVFNSYRCKTLCKKNIKRIYRVISYSFEKYKSYSLSLFDFSQEIGRLFKNRNLGTPLRKRGRGWVVKRKSSLLRVSQYHLTSFFKSLFYSPRYNVIPNGRSWKFSIKRTKYSSARIIHSFTY